MSQGTGIGLIDETLNVGANVISGGLIGFNKEGFKPGVTGKVVVEGTKEITGANAAEEANQIARDQYEDEVKRRDKQRADQVATDERRQISLSKSAGSARKTSSLTSSSNQAGTAPTTDFLGL